MQNDYKTQRTIKGMLIVNSPSGKAADIPIAPPSPAPSGASTAAPTKADQSREDFFAAFNLKSPAHFLVHHTMSLW
jgi:hypothetical protein